MNSRESEISARDVLEGIQDPALVIASDMTVAFMNRAAREFYFHEDSPREGIRCYEFLHGAEPACRECGPECPVQEVLASGKPFQTVHEHLGRDGEPRFFRITACPARAGTGPVSHVVQVQREITEEVKAKKDKETLLEWVFNAEKEKSIRRLAEGIAQEFNNKLVGILGNAEMLERRFPRPCPERKIARELMEAAEKMAETTGKLLSIARREGGEKSRVFLDRAVHEALLVSGKKKRGDMKVVLDIQEGTWPVLGDLHEMITALVNLIENAFEAMSRKGGTLEIRTRNMKREQPWRCPLGGDFPAGDYVHLQVRDEGCGIREGNRRKIFEPFFTTKEPGRGLGLSLVLRQVQDAKGCIWVESRPGKGAAFHVYLPRCP